MNETNRTDPATPTCCGVTCETAYCPHCGVKLRDPSKLLEIIRYLDDRQQSATKRGNNASASEFVDWICTLRGLLNAETQAEAGKQA